MYKLLLISDKENYLYELKTISTLFFSEKDVLACQDDLLNKSNYKDVPYFKVEEKEDYLLVHLEFPALKKSEKIKKSADSKAEIKKMLYDILSQISEKEGSPWGTLTGVRPVKMVHEWLDQGKPIHLLREKLSRLHRTRADKVDLMIEVAEKERPLIFPIDPKALSLYLCIPFCPTRCSYCSFPSNCIEKKGFLVDQYFNALLKELDATINSIEKSGMFVDCVYIGGGTPTSVDIQYLERLLKGLKKFIDLKALKEFTVEAGRPDTLSLEKLELLKRYDVSRICINPQTMNDQTLQSMGRNHSSEDVIQIFKMAKKINFHSINMDLIIGLPGEGLEAIQNTFEEVLALEPENLTVHALAIKRASQYNNQGFQHLEEEMAMEEMANYIREKLAHANYFPYYMYRQKKIAGHLENIGYSKVGYESLYNMRIMEERHSIIALGAGSVSKLCYPLENRHERLANLKGLEEYIQRIDEVIEKKKIIKTLIGGH